MKIKALTAAVSIGTLAWLGISFATPSEVSADPRFQLYVSEVDVTSEHPDSHRLGVLMEEEVALPEWEERSVGSELALVH